MTLTSCNIDILTIVQSEKVNGRPDPFFFFLSLMGGPLFLRKLKPLTPLALPSLVMMKKLHPRAHGDRTIRDLTLAYSDLRVIIVLNILFPGWRSEEVMG